MNNSVSHAFRVSYETLFHGHSTPWMHSYLLNFLHHFVSCPVFYSEIPYDELISVAEFLGEVLSCDVDSLPTELLAHGFWHIGEHSRANKTAASVKLAPCTRRLR